MENSGLRKLIKDSRQWIEQERAWDEMLLASAPSLRGADLQSQKEPRRSDLDVSNSEIAASAFPVKEGGKPPRHDSAKTAALAALYDQYKSCARCPLGATRIKFVFGVGSAEARVMFIGEGPGYEEDRRGEPFVGKAGQLLDRMLEAIGLSRQTVYIANIVKCHAMVNPQAPELRGNDRPPSPLEVETCSPILQRQIAIIRPRIIVTLGSPSTKALLQTSEGITRVRGRFFPFPLPIRPPAASESDLFGSSHASQEETPPAVTPEIAAGIQILPTYHPAALLRNPNLKPEAWEDLKLLRDTLDLKPR